MQFTIFKLSLLATAALAQADFLPADLYAKVGAPLARIRIDAFRKQHSGAMNDAQREVIDLAVEVVNTAAMDKLDSLVEQCHVVFGDEACAQLFSDDNFNAPTKRAMLHRSVPSCECSTGTDFCAITSKCIKQDASKCTYRARTFTRTWTSPLH